MSYFRAENLSLHFGGLKAVDSVSFAVEKGEILSIIGPNGAGKSSIFNLISRIYPPTSGRIFFEDQDITEQPAYEIAGLGIARTFQNIELFENATMLSNLLVGRHRHSTTQLWQELLFMPSVRAGEKVHRRRVEQVIECAVENSSLSSVRRRGLQFLGRSPRARSRTAGCGGSAC